MQPGLSGARQAVAERRMRARPWPSFPGIIFLDEDLSDRADRGDASGFTAAVVVKVYGPDLDALEHRRARRRAGARRSPGAIDVQQQSPPGMPQVNVTLRPDRSAALGLDAVEVLELIRTAYQGDVVGQAYEGNVVFNVIVTLDAAARARLHAGSATCPYARRGGAYVLLNQVADVYKTSGRYQVLHHRRAARPDGDGECERARPRIVRCRRQERRLPAKSTLPPGAHVEFAGAAEAQARSRRDLLVNSLLAATGIVLLLSVRQQAIGATLRWC